MHYELINGEFLCVEWFVFVEEDDLVVAGSPCAWVWAAPSAGDVGGLVWGHVESV